jgi:hypothetical protein
LLIIFPPVEFGNIYIFEFQNGPINLPQIIVEKSNFESIVELWKVFHNVHPIFASDRITLQHGSGFVVEHIFFHEGHLEAADAGRVAELTPPELRVVNLVAYIVFAFHHEINF